MQIIFTESRLEQDNAMRRGQMLTNRIQGFFRASVFDVEIARQYVADGSYFWNAGIFVLRASAWIGALTRS